MEDFRSRSYGDGRMEMEVYGSRSQASVSGTHDRRSYSASYASSQSHTQVPQDMNRKKGNGVSASSSSKGGWSLSDPELQRRKRVAGYKAYAMEGKMKGSLKKGFRWLKDRIGWCVGDFNLLGLHEILRLCTRYLAPITIEIDYMASMSCILVGLGNIPLNSLP
ncbi:hypothetical protein ZIOFF_047528 [Zingiber officinale]|uniref:Uncharacterized protein n=1 Tax=Zingiber officinale TaxID=94328 RepID=A0A8J5G681_ZINOF|nr:hypothetical protein ZIOFF_047528 [Zingiber officinale]